MLQKMVNSGGTDINVTPDMTLSGQQFQHGANTAFGKESGPAVGAGIHLNRASDVIIPGPTVFRTTGGVNGPAVFRRSASLHLHFVKASDIALPDIREADCFLPARRNK